MNSVSDGSFPLGDPPVVEHPTPNGVTEIAQRLSRFPFTPPDVKLKEEDALSASKDWFTKHDKNEIDQLDSLDFYAASGPQSVGVVPKLHNTSAGIEIYELPSTLSKEAFEKTEGPYRSGLIPNLLELLNIHRPISGWWHLNKMSEQPGYVKTRDP